MIQTAPAGLGFAGTNPLPVGFVGDPYRSTGIERARCTVLLFETVEKAAREMMPAAPFINRHGRHLLLRYKRVFRSTRWRSIQTLQLPQASVVAPQLGARSPGELRRGLDGLKSLAAPPFDFGRRH
jgi:hypothetical protein